MMGVKATCKQANKKARVIMLYCSSSYLAGEMHIHQLLMKHSLTQLGKATLFT